MAGKIGSSEYPSHFVDLRGYAWGLEELQKRIDEAKMTVIEL
jgi:hypothetical protein